MIQIKGNKMIFTGKEEKMISKYAKEHKLSFRDVVYLALINGIAKEEGILNEKETKKLRN